MSVLRFAEEFSQLVMRYMKHMPLNNKSKSVIVPLTNEQITYTIHHVLRALGIKNDDNENDDDSVANIVTSNKEVVSTDLISSKINGSQDNENTCRSQDEFQSVTDSSLSDTSLKAIEKETENSLNTLQSEKKFISRSNPSICVIGRSDTFVCKEDQKLNNDIQDDVFENNNNVISLHSQLNNNFLKSLAEIRESALNITLKIDDLKKQTFDKQSQRLLSNSLLNLNRTSTIIKKEPTKIRRSMTTFSGSILSPNLHIAEKEDNLTNRRKSTGMANNIITPRKLGTTKVDHSMSKLSESVLYNKTSPGLIPKLTKNPKYAHVKSTIPKPIVCLNKRKSSIITVKEKTEPIQ
ncbi:hypothetical protein EAG_09799 [Camponotus floridanus]|uniref:Uncharacterized protein n=1 Tax=Camponotus floridanus TaxID=104421 RepID=E2AUS8_CAMFO|nr:uncharacterized protein LOC105256277 [Camponotus floridanus]EFN62803.1 hypothetical protein EAG_09799 [Camponotus floridanus]